MIERLFDKVATTERLKAVEGSTSKRAYSTHLESLRCHLQPLDASTTSDFAGTFGKDYLLFAEVADLKEADRVIIDDRVFKVTGVEVYDSLARNQHVEATLRIFE